MSQAAIERSQAPAGGAAAPAVGGEYLAFRLAAEEYGVDILKVQEIRCYEKVTRIANTPSFIKGVVNLRGTIVPILDMRIRLALGEPEYNEFTVVIILNLSGRMVGIVVDAVSDVLNIASEQIRAAPDVGRELDARYITGLGTIDERLLILMDVEKLIAGDGLGVFAADIIQ
jgi:purine-binding chemotaxis protein CheW